MFDDTSDGCYTPGPADVHSGDRWPWAVAALGVAVIVAGGLAFSSGAAEHGQVGTPASGSESSASR
jgi:hypothetical protein